MILGNSALRKIALEENFKIQRYGDEIVVYKAWHENGFVTLYVNRSTDKILTEHVEYQLKGLELEGLEGDKSVFIRIGPGEEQLIKIVETGEGERELQTTILSKKVTTVGEAEK